MKTILITGSSGFIAGHTATLLSQEPFRVIGVDMKPIQMPGINKVYESSLLDSLEHVFATEKIDVVIHLKWPTSHLEISLR